MPTRLILSAILLLGTLALCDPRAAADPVDGVEEVSDVSEAAPVAVPGPIEFLGRLHPAAVHFPIAWLVLVLLLDLGGFVFGRDGWRPWSRLLGLATIASFVPAAASGFLRANELAARGTVSPLLGTHRALVLCAAGVFIAAVITRFVLRDDPKRTGRWIYLLLVASAAGLIAVAGHLGGEMVFGEDFLPF